MRALLVTIDCSALLHNVKRIRQLAPNSQIMAMVKANAYGHGIYPIAESLANQVDGFGVACLEEALQLRSVGIKNNIALLQGFYDEDELTHAAQFNLDLVIHHQEQLQQVAKFTQPLRLWLKFNTGMNRLGFSSEQLPFIKTFIGNTHHQIVGYKTHMHSADKLDNPQTHRQLQQFRQWIKALPSKPLSIGNSACVLAWPDTHVDWVRPGIMLYGVSPFAGKTGLDHQLQPVMTYSTEVISCYDLAPGEGIGYGVRFTAKKTMRIAIVAAGYGDGYPRSAIDGTPVLINGQRCPLVGCVSMDMLAVDVTNKNVAVNDPVILWGKGLPVEEVAEKSNTIGYELLTRVSLPRVATQVSC